ncbi:MAG TPA: hypothetical protein VJ302_26300, partial [Blastocatellia bacterium]|nr:hypothetical protein [Blastocatellia bacterium]
MFTEEGRTRLRNFRARLRSYLLACAAIGVLLGGFYWWFWVWGGFRPLEKIYFPAYIVATLKTWLLPETNTGRYTMLATESVNNQFTIVTDEMVSPVRDEAGQALKGELGDVFRANEGVRTKPFAWRKIALLDHDAERLFRQAIYNNSLLGLFEGAATVALVITLG